MMSTPQSLPKPYCDLVMKGGITSGVVYPKLIAKLAEHYRFKSVGGTSAGAIAAGACAAAEFGRRSGDEASFQKLAQLPTQLGKATEPGSPSMLLQLFQPSPALSKHFDVLLGSLNKPDRLTLFVSAIAMLLRKFNPFAWLTPLLIGLALIPVLKAAGNLSWVDAALASFLGLISWVAVGSLILRLNLRRTTPTGWAWRFLLWWLGGALAIGMLVTAFADLNVGSRIALVIATAFDWAVMGALGILLAVVIGCFRFVKSLLAGLHKNQWGVCSGLAQADRKGPGLTEWMYDYFNDLAGIGDPERPLTFGDLWRGSLLPLPIPPHDYGVLRESLPREIDLQVMTTAISQSMCYALPWRQSAPQFYFDPAEWRRLFPEAVVKWLESASRQEWVPRKHAEGTDAAHLAQMDATQIQRADGTTLVRLPSNEHLPVVVAVRMSLSFPILLSAVPLYALDYSGVKGGEAKPHIAKRVWFSDGGIASNMPLHFFDAPLPSHPTFAVNLKSAHPAYPIRLGEPASAPGNGRVYLPSDNAAGLQRYWAPPSDDKPVGVFSFLASIVDTMQNWRDEIQFPYPGYRDRIVQISQKPDEGGLNLNMPPENIDALSEAGECAANKLLEKFLTGTGAVNTPVGTATVGWTTHQKIRLKTFIGLSVEFVQSPALQQSGGPWSQLVGQLGYTSNQAAAATDLLAGLRALGQRVDAEGLGLRGAMPRPRASVKISPKI